ncbi:MAG TPA: glucose-1-phosphate adenylyltransferase [Candidatus Omnitrophota bacterium]|nr:glucose-1-phosphate adenylyltransferase [Candidatus Omnitrophota bacterium]
MKNVLSVILGGGRGTRLYPLTKYRAKPAVPLAGKYRLIDIPISNCLNSGLQKIFVLTQFNSVSLNRHIFRAYKFDTFSQGYVEILAAEQSMEHGDWFQGSADAVRKCLRHFSDPRIEYILILSGDQLYKMNFISMLNFHFEKRSDITIACNPVEPEETRDLGIMGIDKTRRIRRFIEKPGHKKEIAGMEIESEGRKKYLASMGIYIFKKEVLTELLTSSNKADFGKEVIPDALAQRRAFAYVHTGYWKDIGSITSFYEENMAFTRARPPIDLFDEKWPFFTRPRYLPLSKISDAVIKDSDIAEGTVIASAEVRRSIIGLRSRIGGGSRIEDSIIMGNDYYDNSRQAPTLGIGKNCHIRKAIIDKNVRMGDNVRIINRDRLVDFENEFCVIRNGIVIIPKAAVIPSGTVI